MKKRCHGGFTPLIWGLFTIFLSFSCQLMWGEEKAETHLTSLEVHSFLDAELTKTIQEKIHARDNLNLAVKVYDPEFYFHLHRNRMIKSHSLENSLYTTSLFTMAALNFADYFTTMKALKCEGLREANPLVQPLTKNAALFAAVKIGITVSHFHFMKNLYQKNKKLAWVVSLISNAVMGYVVVHNLNMINQAGAK